MSEEERAAFTDEEVLQHAQGNFNYFHLASIAFLKDQALSPAEYIAWMGDRVAVLWEVLREGGALATARMAALNWVSVGSTLRSLSGDEAKAEAVVSGWPPADVLSFFELSQADGDTLCGLLEPIAAHLGLQYRWKREGDAVRMTFWR